jgi:hypothetical protein
MISFDGCTKSVEIDQYDLYELIFSGRQYVLEDNPVRDIQLLTTWRHENKTLSIYGYYDGDGQGGPEGNSFKVRFCPIIPGKWRLVNVASNDPLLQGQHEGFEILCSESSHPGFWIPDERSEGKRWYRRSNGMHSYIIGNTFYSFISEYGPEGPTGRNIQDDIINSSDYFNKIRFAITGDIYPNPEQKPFLDKNGNPTDDGNFSHRPNPGWFGDRVDLAVRTCYEQDIIADIIVNGPDSPLARSVLNPAENGGDNRPILRYIASRYGSYPNVWICLSNEYNIREPQFTESQIVIFGYRIREFLPYPTPVSVHANQQDWDTRLNREKPWNDHVILQNKIKTLYAAADFAEKNYWKAGGNKPVINDELAYEGAGDGWSEEDVIEAHLGAFLGGSYGSTGFKSGHKLGHYFMGDFDAKEHTSADNLGWMQKVITENISFWKMEPVPYSYTGGITSGIFQDLEDSFRVLSWPGHEYVLGSNQEKNGIQARLPAGIWKVTQYDVTAMEEKLLSASATGSFHFNVPASRAVITYFRKIEE